MFRLLKILLALALIAGLLYGASYAGSRLAAGKVVGPSPTFMGERKIELNLKGVEGLEGNPRAWVYTYGPTQLPGVRTATIYVTLEGRLIRTRPRNLAERVELYRDRDP
jgi:hypothetical protein